MQREPLEGFQRVSLEQVAAADREVHVRLAEKTRAGLGKDSNGDLPLDAPLKEVLQSSEIRWMLIPLPTKFAAKTVADRPKPKAEDAKQSPKNNPKKSNQQRPGAQGPKVTERTNASSAEIRCACQQ